MSHSDKTKIDLFIDECVTRYLFEDEQDDNLEDMLKFINDEEKRVKVEIDTDNRVKAAQINPDERKIKETNIKRNKERLEKMKTMKASIEKQQQLRKAESQAQEAGQQAQQQQSVSMTSKIGFGMNENKSAPLIRRGFAEQAPAQAPITPQQPKKRPVRVVFDKSTGTPFYVDFSERGFSIDGTRLSFEIIESALSKQFNIVLNQGNGLMLDQVKMQKILKYKDRF